MTRYATVVFVILVGLATAAPPAKSNAPLHFEAAVALVATTAPEDTHYEHGTGTVTFKGRDGAAKSTCHTDCSGLLNNLLRAAYNISEADLREWTGSTRPSASLWHDVIAKGNRFTRITNLSQALPGDVIAVKYPPGAEATGHVMFVAAAPTPREASEPIVSGTQQWDVQVIDSSSSGHGPTDTRRKPDGKYRNGLGTGPIRIYTDAQGAIAGYAWSGSSGSDFYSQSKRHLELGRLSLK
jgi:hypothetical protein